ncbi:MAG: ABC transporter permease [Wenzhouxiangellaceae bacterium]
MISMLNRKLLRDLWHLRGQLLAIALVISGGVATWVIAFSSIDSLQLSQNLYYQDYRFAQIFAHLKRAPRRLLRQIEQIPGITDAETQVVAPATLELDDFDEPVEGLITSLPDEGAGRINRVYLHTGRLPEPRSADVVISQPFAEAHGLAVGDQLRLIINGRRQALRISGIGLSPEYVFQIRPGALFPDHQRYTVMWMRREALARAVDMEGAFNYLVARLSYQASEAQVIERLDALLGRWGGAGAYGRADQVSHNYLYQEMLQLRTMARIVPIIFLGVAAFLLNVVVTRLVQQQREQVAVLKAFGYRQSAIAWHYLLMVLFMVALGIIPGVALGAYWGQGLAEMYSYSFRFPELYYRVHPLVAVSAALVAAVAGVSGTLNALRQAFSLPPAEAMRPQPPARYRATLVERLGLAGWLDQPSRMILRSVERRPLKTLLAIIGVAMAIALLVVGQFQEDTIDYLLDVQFAYTQREDMIVTFTEPQHRSALHELAALPGISQAEPYRFVAVKLIAGHRSKRTVIQGYTPDASLHRVMDSHLRPIPLPASGLIMTDYLADELGLKPGDWVDVQVLEGARRHYRTQLAGLSNEYIGVSAYMRLDALNRLVGESSVISGVFLLADQAYLQSIYRQLRQRPGIAGTTLRQAAIDSFYDTMGENLLIFSLINTLLAGVIAFGVVYNTARMALAERGRELASLRVLGFRRREVAYILLGEIALIILLAIPLGLWIGHWLADGIAVSMASEYYRIPAVLESSSYGFAVVIVLLAGMISAAVVARRLYGLDLIAVLKTRE